jgi:hypothetical protein
MPSRRNVAGLALLPVAAVAAVLAACSSQAPERVVDSSEAITGGCSATQIRSCDFNEITNKVYCWCDTWVTPNTDLCQNANVPVPPALTGCKPGVWMSNGTPYSPLEAMWACPDTMRDQLPQSLGVGPTTGAPVCQFSSDAGPPTNVGTTGCEEVLWVDSVASSCIDLPVGWGLVWDHRDNVCCVDPTDPACGTIAGGCGGPCGYASPPPR